MKKWHMIVDLAKCVGCFNCMLACKDEYVGNTWLPYTMEQKKHDQKWIYPQKYERGVAPYTEVCFVTKLCQHCDDAPCAKKCPDAVMRRDDGIILFDVEKSKGNKELAKACPYGMSSWNEELEVAQKCTACAHLMDNGWGIPRCVQACPLRAINVVMCEDAEFEKIVKKQKLKPLTDGSNKPRVMYKNLYKYNKCFITGGLAYHDGEIEKAATGANIQLMLNGEVVKEQKADFFGEFKIDKIPPDSGTFTLVCMMDGYKTIKQDVTIGKKSPDIGLMMFEKE